MDAAEDIAEEVVPVVAPVDAPGSSRQDAEEEEVECRICRLPAALDEPLFHPCRCSGSVRFVHQACLDQWLKHSGRTFCEVRRRDEQCRRSQRCPSVSKQLA